MTCSSDQAIAALGYLRHSFGGYPMSDDESRPYLRLFVKLTPAELRDAIDMLVVRSDRRPSPNEIASEIRKHHRPSVPDTRSTDPVASNEHAAAHVRAIKEEAGIR